VKTKRNIVTSQKADPEVVTSIRLTREQHEKLKRLAAAQERSVSQHLRFVVDKLEEAA
jgi:predicted DNA-binding protein